MPGSDASAPLAVDHILGGRYRLIGPIARGGMAEVWEGYDEILTRPVAVKVLLSHLATDQVVRERFRREAITAARLAHPTVVATYDTGLDGGVAYIVMELVRGRTLRQLLAERGPLAVPVAVSIADQIADALAHAHRAGLVHRDIKPANVLIGDDDGPLPRIKVTDFGIAKAAESVGVDLTSTGMVLGTPKYLSPEQVEGREPDARADLYALGVVLFEMLAGAPPFTGPTEMATALAHLRDEAPLVSTRRPGVPAELDRIVATLLAKDPASRFASAGDLRRTLAGVSRPPASPPPLGPPPSGDPTTAVGRPPTQAVRMPPVDATSALGGPIGAPRPGINGTARIPMPAPRSPGSPPKGDGERRPARRRRRRGPGIVVAALVLAGVAVAAVLLTSNGSGGMPSIAGGGTPSAPLALRTARVFVLSGHQPDDPAGAPNVVDGNPATVWSTDVYSTAHFGNLYPGIGLAVQLDGSHTLHRMTVTSPAGGWSAETYVSSSFPAGASGVGVWGAPTDSRTATGTTTTFSLGGRTGSWVLLWLTATGGPPYRAQIGEITVS